MHIFISFIYYFSFKVTSTQIASLGKIWITSKTNFALGLHFTLNIHIWGRKGFLLSLLVVISHFTLVTLGRLWNRLYLYGSPFFSHIILGYRHLWALEAKWKFHWISINPLTTWDWASCQNSNCPSLSEPSVSHVLLSEGGSLSSPQSPPGHPPPAPVCGQTAMGDTRWWPRDMCQRLGSDSLPALF